MYPTLLHLYGSLYIQSYGAAIVIGILLATYFVLKHPHRAQYISQDQYYNLLVGCIIAAVLGAHILCVLSNPEQFETWWDILIPWHGLSVLGSVIAGAFFIIFYLRRHNIPILPVLDIAAIYVPLIQAFGRVGCFLSGCCHGMPACVPWAITYFHPQTAEAPLFIPLHPTQLYSASLLFLIFLYMHFKAQYQFKKHGQLAAIYIMLIACERFIIDFFRGQKIYGTMGWFITLTTYQWLSLGMFIWGGILFIVVTRNQPKRNTNI